MIPALGPRVPDDGFRFDLMGIHDVTTMNAIRERWMLWILAFPLWRGWDMGTGLAPEDKTKKDNAVQLPRIGFFNDTERDAIKELRFMVPSNVALSAENQQRNIVARAVLGSAELGHYLSPNQV